MDKESILKSMKDIAQFVASLPMPERVTMLNDLRKTLAEASPFKAHPVDCIQWVPMEQVVANDYNPNKVAPPEMRLLALSVREDGYTQPIVTYFDKDLQQDIVVDGFHRNRLPKEYPDIREQVFGYLPLVFIDKDISGRMASTIRHNRARGTHQVQGMAEIVAELHLKGMSDKKIGEELGMEKDEVLRLKQFMGLGDLFKNRDFSKAWV